MCRRCSSSPASGPSWFAVVATRVADGDQAQFQLNRGKMSVGTYPGSVVGVLVANGKHYVVAKSQGRATAIALL